MRLARDHHYAPAIAELLREADVDCVAAVEQGWRTEPDEAMLGLCAEQRRALLTDNVADFAVIARRWQAEGRSHAGRVFTSDASMPRTRHTIGVTWTHSATSPRPTRTTPH